MATRTPQILAQLVQTLSIGLIQEQQAIDNATSSPITSINSFLRHSWETYLCWCFQSETSMNPPVTWHQWIALLHRPLSDWPEIGDLCEQAGYMMPLLENGRPSFLCEEIGASFIDAADPLLEMQDSAVQNIQQIARQLNLPDQYIKARELIGRNPILVDPIFAIQSDSKWQEDIRTLLSQCYEPIPLACIRGSGKQRYLVACPVCGWVLEWKRDEAVCHKKGNCAEREGDLGGSGKVVPYTKSIVRTVEGIQRFVVAPEIALLRLYDRLRQEWDLRCELFPNFDAFDLLITFASGVVWAVDFKDQRDPTRLARDLNENPFAWGPAWDRAFYVFPDYRAEKGYLNTFAGGWKLQKDVFYSGLSAFIEQVQREIRK